MVGVIREEIEGPSSPPPPPSNQTKVMYRRNIEIVLIITTTTLSYKALFFFLLHFNQLSTSLGWLAKRESACVECISGKRYAMTFMLCKDSVVSLLL